MTTLLLLLSRDNGFDHQVLCPVHECLKACSQCFKRKFSHLAPITRASGSRTVAFGRGRIIPVNELDRHAVYLSISTVFTNYFSISTRNVRKRRVGTVWPSDEIIYSFSTFYLSDLFVIIIATTRMYLIQSNLCGTRYGNNNVIRCLKWKIWISFAFSEDNKFNPHFSKCQRKKLTYESLKIHFEVSKAQKYNIFKTFFE